METDSRKPKKWVGISNEPNCKFTTSPLLPCMCCYSWALLTCPACSVLPLSRFALPAQPCPYFTLFCPTLLPCSWPCQKDKSKTPTQNPNLSLSSAEAILAGTAWLQSNCTNTCT